jgi:uncharacterized membrane protein
MPEFVEIARKKYPDYEFLIGDYFEHPLKKKFDIVITSGTLNSNIVKVNPIYYRKKAIKIMFDHAREILAFNMAGGYPQPKNKKNYNVYFADSLEILKYCFSLTSKLIFRHQYRIKDFTIILFKK